ncbi:MAG: chorismate mutase [Planctomycetes bacterium]|nr:chorismate mutase [Planctomycetota bacterium]
MLRGVRGAITVSADTKDEILDATEELLKAMAENNNIDVDDVASIFFSLSPDLHSAFPAAAARRINWTSVALFCQQELEISGAMEKCIRVLIHWNTDKAPAEIKHIYLRDATRLRPDLIAKK